jgi:hypothetical protein
MIEDLEIIGREDNPPDPSRLIESLRDSGYSFNTAIADIIDNSITADAKNIHVVAEMDMVGDIKVFISDDGKGMTYDELIDAMKYGSPKKSHPKSLSKFGLGLKTASTGFCKNLSVLTRSNDGKANKACWDLEYIATKSNGKWTTLILKVTDDDSARLDNVAKDKAGTIVIWDKVDRLINKRFTTLGGQAHRNALSRILEDLKKHLALVFQRFLDENDAREDTIIIKVNGQKIKPWDPFCAGETATEIVAEEETEIDNGDQTVKFKIKAYVLPLKEEFSSEEAFKNADQGTDNQGIYVYRENRLILGPDWLNMYSKEPHFNLLRVEFSFTHELDEAFKVDFMKSKVNIDENLYDHLVKFLAPARREAEAKYRKKQKSNVSIQSKSAHDLSNKNIGEKSDQVQNSTVLKVNSANNSAEIQNQSGRYVISIPIIHSNRPGELYVQPVDSIDDGLLWQPCIIDKKHAVRINTGHTYYHKVYVPNLMSGVTIQGMDSLLWALCEAELSTWNDTTKNHFRELRYEVSRILRKLVEDLPEPIIETVS